MTVADVRRDFVIESQADALLGEIAADFADALLDVASQITQSRTQGNVPLVTVCDVAAAASLMCKLMDLGEKSGELDEGEREMLSQMKVVCETFLKECHDAGSDQGSSRSRKSAHK